MGNSGVEGGSVRAFACALRSCDGLRSGKAEDEGDRTAQGLQDHPIARSCAWNLQFSSPYRNSWRSSGSHDACGNNVDHGFQNDPEIQKRIFNIVGFSEEEAERRFGFLLKAFRYGPPPHGGIAPGLDRLVMVMAREESIKEVIAFPKNNVGINPMDDSPSPVDEDQLRELGLKLELPEEEPEDQ